MCYHTVKYWYSLAFFAPVRLVYFVYLTSTRAISSWNGILARCPLALTETIYITIDSGQCIRYRSMMYQQSLPHSSWRLGWLNSSGPCSWLGCWTICHANTTSCGVTLERPSQTQQYIATLVSLLSTVWFYTFPLNDKTRGASVGMLILRPSLFPIPPLPQSLPTHPSSHTHKTTHTTTWQ